MRPIHGIAAFLVAVLVAILLANTHPAGTSGLPTIGPTAPARWTAPVWTGGEANAERHWEKHGAQFRQYAGERAYVAGVHAFLLHPPAGTLVKHRGNGDTLYFDPASGIFAVQALDGAPRTFFKPDNGREYWERQ
jgi:pyocin large subunit-like protein